MKILNHITNSIQTRSPREQLLLFVAAAFLVIAACIYGFKNLYDITQAIQNEMQSKTQLLLWLREKTNQIVDLKNQGAVILSADKTQAVITNIIQERGINAQIQDIGDNMIQISWKGVNVRHFIDAISTFLLKGGNITNFSIKKDNQGISQVTMILTN